LADSAASDVLKNSTGSSRLTAGHAILAGGALILLWRSLGQPWVDAVGGDPLAAGAMRLILPSASGAASCFTIWLGHTTRRQRSALIADATSLGTVLVLVFGLALGPVGRDVAGVLLVVVVAIRFAPPVLLSLRGEATWAVLFALALSVYAASAGWHQVASLPLGDQVHYLLAADRLAHGSLDATIDPPLFRKLTTIDATDSDVATHVVNVPAGPRTVQGYAIPLLLIPGWVAAGRFGAELVVALAAAWAATMTALILRDTVADARLRGWVWAMTAFFAPLVLLADSIYPNAFGAAAIATAYRFGFTAPNRRPFVAGAIGGLTLFLNPRDGLVLIVLLVAAVWYGRAFLLRFAIGAAAMLILATIADTLIYGLPVPYAGYLGGTSQAQVLTSAPSITFQFWVGLPAMLFDRTFGLAGSAPWVFIAVIGAVPALRAAPRALAPAAAAIVTSLLALSLYRYWEGGYAPPNRYFVEVLPLTAPFVAYGLAAARDWWMRTLLGVLIGMSALAAFLLSAMPARALNDAFQSQLQDLFDVALGVNPLGWLPSFIPVTPDWWVSAYLRLVPAVAIVALLAWYGARKRAPA
jgi:hypothetical protein